MIIGIDGNEANVENRVGSNQYAYGIICALYKLHPKKISFIVYLKEKPLKDLPEAADWWQYRVLTPGFAWTQWRLPLSLLNPFGRPDVFYSPGHYAPRFSPIPTAVSVMDLAFIKMPQLFLSFKRGTKQLADWTKYSVKQASGVFAISNHTKKDIQSIYGISPEKIHVAYPGVDLKHFKEPDGKTIKIILKKYKLPDKYILHLGTIQPRKNLVRLIKAFETLPQKYKSWHLVLAGQSGWMTEEIDKSIKQSPLKNRIITTGFVDNQDIPSLMFASGCLAMVGLYEGFGMPPAEAFGCGTIPVVSNNTSLPEVVGDAGILIDPYSVASIRHGIMVALDLKQPMRLERLEMGKKHIQKFNWDKSAQKVLDVLTSLTTNHS